MNVRDSEVVAGLLKKSGYKICDNPDNADAIIFNTCSVREHAEDKVWSEIGRVSKVKKGTVPKMRGQSPFFKPIIGLIGCMAQNYKETAFERSADIDFVVGPQDIDKIPGILEKLSQKWGQSPKIGDSPHFFSPHFFERKIWETDSEIRPEEIYHTGFYEDKSHAFVVISEGCSNFCSYCVVPYVRGALRHRNYKDIIQEIEEAVDNGITSITLLGQNVNAYVSPGKSGTVPKNRGQSPISLAMTEGINFVELLGKINAIKGLKEFSFVTSHPKDTSLELFKAMAELEKLKKYLHLPVQSGSDKILKLMNRAYTRKMYLDLAENYRKIVKGGSLTTDIIVGFPGESEEDFKDTLDLVKDIRFNAAYIFKYSPRPHTEASKLADTVEKEEKEKRHKLILELQKEISNKIKNEKLK